MRDLLGCLLPNLVSPLNCLWKLLAINPLLYIFYWFYLSSCTMTALPTILTQLLSESGLWVQCHKLQQSLSGLILIVLLVLFVIVNLILWYNLFLQSLQTLLHLLAQINSPFFFFFLILAIPTRMEWHLVVVLIIFSKCKWFLTSFNFFYHLYIFVKIYFHVFTCFINAFFLFFYFWVLRLPDVFWTLVLFQLCCLQIFFPSLNEFYQVLLTNKIVWSFFFCITLIDFKIKSALYISGINPTRSWYKIFLYITEFSLLIFVKDFYIYIHELHGLSSFHHSACSFFNV